MIGAWTSGGVSGRGRGGRGPLNARMFRLKPAGSVVESDFHDQADRYEGIADTFVQLFASCSSVVMG